jgi:hypothetical protein
MGTKPVARFTIEVDGIHRSLFSVVEKRDGDLTLGLSTDLFHREKDQNPWLSPVQRKKILNQYYQIHPSFESVEGVNVINHHKYFETGKIEKSQYTRAIKRGDKFGVIFIRRCASHRFPHDIAKPNRGKIISIGSYDPKFCTLIYAVAASAVGKELKTDRPQINIAFHDFKLVRLTVVSTFVTMAATDLSLTGHLTTITPTDGHEPGEVIAEFATEVMVLMEELLETLKLSPQEREAARERGLVTRRGTPDDLNFLRYVAFIKGEYVIYGHLLPWPLV